MATSSTMSVSLIPMGDSSQKAVVFDIKLKRGQTLSQMYMNPDIIMGLMFEHMNVKTLLVQKLDRRAILLIFQENEDVERICATLRSIER